MALLRRKGFHPTMMNPVAAIVAMAMIAYPVIAQSEVACPNDGGTDLQGYTSLASLNSDMQLELGRISSGGAPAPPYTFTLCPNMAFDTALVTLQPVLSGATFVCGANGDPDDACTFLGGDEQIRIEDSTVDGYLLEELVFVGISFADFASSDEMLGTSIAALASSITTATFVNNRWSTFTSDFVVRQMNEVSTATPMNVQINGGSVRNGMAGAVFDNDGGFLTVNDFEASNVMTVSLIATANGGVSFLQNSNITSCTLDQVTFTTAQGAQTVVDTIISGMLGLRDVFYVEDTGSSLNVIRSTIRDNDITSNSWAGFTILNGASARVAGTEITSNSGVEFAAAAGGVGSALDISDSIISENTGVASLNITSAPILGITDAQVTMNRVEINENFDFTGQILVLFRSVLTITESCLQGGSGDFVIFVDNASDFMANMNFISPETEATFRCQSGGPRLFKEDANSGCFVGGACTGECQVAATEETCPLISFPSGAPSFGPTRDPGAPTAVPTTGAPSVSVPPSASPTFAATTLGPSTFPSSTPTLGPTTLSPTMVPTEAPTQAPTSEAPTRRPTDRPTMPEDAPTINPTETPSTSAPTLPQPTSAPTISSAPTIVPPTRSPTVRPTETPTSAPVIAVNTLRPTFGKNFSKKGGKKNKSKKNKSKKNKSKKGGKKHKGMKGSKGGKGMKGKSKRGYYYRRDLSELPPRRILNEPQQDEESLRR